jgi:bifunctional UDP-N-acetylglucosamine pyrophosphorylase/glucosamine-1-phosphate N-acetyltransferase
LSEAAAIILAAGQSTRMNSDLPKVLHEVCGQPMLAYVLSACRLAGVSSLAVVVGHGQDQVRDRFAAEADVTWVEQAKQRGTGHAVLCCRAVFQDFSGSLLVVAGDMPLVRRETLANLVEVRGRSDVALTLATTVLGDPAGYGRIIRDSRGLLEGIVEDGACVERQREINEVNPSYYCFDAEALFEALERVKCDPAKGEYYLTETVSVLRSMEREVSAVVNVAPEDAMGINSRLDLATVNRVMQDRIQLALMNGGVTIVDPDNTWIEADVVVGCETTVYPFTFIGAGATIGQGCRIGPFARIRSGQTLEDGAAAGNGMANSKWRKSELPTSR